MAKKNRSRSVIDCACVIHDRKYDWFYVERLYNMLCRHLSVPVRLHVYTEHDRSVPPHLIKHCLEDWPGVAGPKKSWWYKLHLFNAEHHAGPLLYFDLDCVIVRSLDWILSLDADYFWCVRDFRYLQSAAINTVNSSVMWWDTRRFQNVWQEFNARGVDQTVRNYHGDQDFIHEIIDKDHKRYFEDHFFQSYRWQVADGGWDFRRRRALQPGSGALIGNHCSVIVFHGDPKPHTVRDPKIVDLWR